MNCRVCGGELIEVSKAKDDRGKLISLERCVKCREPSWIEIRS